MKKKSPIQQVSIIASATIKFLIRKEFESTTDSGMRLDLIHSAKSLGLDALAFEMENELKCIVMNAEKCGLTKVADDMQQQLNNLR